MCMNNCVNKKYIIYMRAIACVCLDIGRMYLSPLMHKVLQPLRWLKLSCRRPVIQHFTWTSNYTGTNAISSPKHLTSINSRYTSDIPCYSRANIKLCSWVTYTDLRFMIHSLQQSLNKCILHSPAEQTQILVSRIQVCVSIATRNPRIALIPCHAMNEPFMKCWGNCAIFW